MTAIEKCIAMLDGKHHETKAAAHAELAELKAKADRLETILESLNDAIEGCHTSEVQKGWIMDQEIRDIIINSLSEATP